jgi:molybdopterin-guanine dinucleotide biosynthesis protein A
MIEMLTGAVLAGGKSLRYGRNKALELFHGRRLLDYAITSLRSFCNPLLVVVNDLKPYLHIQATLVQDILIDQGPLGGIHTALVFSPHEWLFAKATDMPFLAPELVSLMLASKEGFDVVVPMLNDRYDPLLALYSRRCLPPIAATLEKGDRKITMFFRKVRVRELTEKEWRTADPEGISFKNVNTPQNLEELKWT